MSMITKEMPIGQVIAKYPESVEIMLKHGLHCIGCSISPYESMEGGALGHGMTEEQLQKMIEELNEKMAGKADGGKNNMGGMGLNGPGKGESGMGGGKSSNSAGAENPEPAPLVSLTPKAAETVRKIMGEERRENAGLRISLAAGGCAGYSYEMEFAEKAQETDEQLTSNGITIFVEREYGESLRGTVIDFRESLQGAGFVMNNPNVKSACGCGKSFGV